MAGGFRWPCSIAGVTRLALGRVVAGAFGMTVYADAEAAVLPGFEKPRGFTF